MIRETTAQTEPQREKQPPRHFETEPLRATWLLPVRNGMPYLSETLASIEAQTYRNFEVLAWDNGSTDGTLEELQRWIPSRLPGRVISDRPLGLGASLREMTLEARTELCARIDADDVNLPQRLEKQVAFLHAHPEIAAVGSQISRLDAESVNHGQWFAYPTRHEDIVHAMLHFNALAHPTMLFRRSAILDVGNYQGVGKVNVEDYDLWLRVAKKYRMANLDEALINYRVHDRSATVISSARNELDDALNDRFAEHATALYGLSAADARLLRERRHPQTLRLLRQIAAHLEAHQDDGVKNRMRVASFQKYARALIAESDIYTRLAFAIAGRNLPGLNRELLLLAKSAGHRVGLGRVYRSARRWKGLSPVSQSDSQSGG